MTHTIDGVIITPEILDTLKDLQEGGIELRIKCIERLTDFVLDYETPTSDPKEILDLVKDCRYLKDGYVSMTIKEEEAV